MEADYKTLSCAHCAAAFSPSTQPKNLYCGKRCKVAAWRKANPDRSGERKVCSVHTGHCGYCSAAFVSLRKRANCSDKCDRAAWHKAHYQTTAPAQRVCACCAAVFQAPPASTRPSDFCSPACKRKAHRKHKSVHKQKRAAASRGVMAESVDPIEVFDRDGWCCQLCGVATPREARGTCAPNAPELDHCVPLAKGGAHTKANTQCLCRSCNGLKSDGWCERSVSMAEARACTTPGHVIL